MTTTPARDFFFFQCGMGFYFDNYLLVLHSSPLDDHKNDVVRFKQKILLVTAAVILLGIYIWPHITRNLSKRFVIVNSTTGHNPFHSQMSDFSTNVAMMNNTTIARIDSNISKIPLLHAKNYLEQTKHLTLSNWIFEVRNNQKMQEKILDNYIPNVYERALKCKAIIEGNEAYVNISKKFQSTAEFKQDFAQQTKAELNQLLKLKNCSAFLIERKYAQIPLSDDEVDFPLAYSILMYRNPVQVEHLLRSIYRPQNQYCIHVDTKAREQVHTAMENLVKCLSNVFLASRSVAVKWGTYTVLEPELICMEDLWNRSKAWRYFINLTGEEFPLKTNAELVKILKAMNGSNMASGTKNINKNRLQHVRWYSKDGKMHLDKNSSIPEFPYNISIYKGPVHIAATRAFVDYVLHNEVALAFRTWVKMTGVPDETFFPSLMLSPQLNVPGAIQGPKKESLIRYKVWYKRSRCKGKLVRSVCVFGIGDLRVLSQRKELFLNKIWMNVEPILYHCLEELHYNRTRDQVLRRSKHQDSYYQKLVFS